jgi:hypothetical protein
MISDETLRARLAGLDPAQDLDAPDVLDRLELDEPPVTRRWGRPVILAAAAVAAVGLFGVAVVPNLFPSGGSSSTAIQAQDRAIDDAPTAESAGTGAEEQPVYPGGPSIIRTASLLIGTEDPTAAADAYVARITALGGSVTSRTDVTEGDAAPATTMDSDAMMPMPYPSGPGVWLTVEVPANRFDEALADAREAGQTVRLEQSAQDVSATVADIDARVRALRSSVAQLRSLMDEATSVSEVIALEDAIAARQSELDGLVAQQRELRNSTTMSQISLALMSPDDAAAAVGDDPPNAWTPARWALGLALTAGLIILVVIVTRRRRDGREA